MEQNFDKKGYLLEDFRLFHLRDSQGVQTEYHYHEFCKLVLLRSGIGSYTVEGRQYPLKPGDVVLLDSGCIHRCTFAPGQVYERIILYLSPEFLHRHTPKDFPLNQCFQATQGPVLHLPEPSSQQLLRLTALLEQELSSQAPGSSVAATGILLQLLVEITRHQQDRSAHWTMPQGPNSPIIRSLLAYLDQNLDQELSIDDLAELCFISKFHLMRQFRQETGTTIHSYVTEKRLFFAKNLMDQGLSSTEACFQSGFGSYSSFTRAYGKLFGMTPTGRSIRRREEDLRE